MSLRFTPEEALARGWIDKSQAEEMSAASRKGRRKDSRQKHDGRGSHISGGESPPQRMLFEAVEARWPGRFQWEFPVRPPGAARSYRLDIASPEDRLCIEMDGWQHHGKFKRDFQRDRVRQNRLSIAGWRILRYFPGQIYSDIDQVVDEIARTLGEPAGD